MTCVLVCADGPTSTIIALTGTVSDMPVWLLIANKRLPRIVVNYSTRLSLPKNLSPRCCCFHELKSSLLKCFPSRVEGFSCEIDTFKAQLLQFCNAGCFRS